MDKNYFSDITELFIKAKNAENIPVNPHSKAAIREMLAYKVDQIKTSEPKAGFFSKWKYQLMGVPASIFAIFLVVFAYQNLQISIPKEDFAPRANEVSSMEQSEAETDMSDESEIKDTPVIEEIVEDIPAKKPELMVIDYEEAKQETAPTTPATPTTPVQPKTGGGPVSQPVVSAPVETVQTEPVTEPTTPEPIIAEPVVVKTPTYIEPQPVEPVPTTNDYILINEEITVQDAVKIPEVDVPQYKINPESISNMMEGDILLPKEDPTGDDPDAVIINEYRQPFLPQTSEFDTEALNAVEKPDSLSSVNVHYLNNTQAAVEVVELDTTRWYLFEDRGGTWTVTQKFD